MKRDSLSFQVSFATETRLSRLGLDLTTFKALALHVQDLPYGRGSSSEDPFQVLRDGRGTCSSKHRLLALVAKDAGRSDIRLTVGIYQMSEANTPGVGEVLARSGLSYVPEAHCYLSRYADRLDFTGLSAGHESPFTSLESEYFVEPEVLPMEKTTIHKRAIHSWSISVGLSFEEAWAVREECIAALSQSFRSSPDNSAV